MEADANKTGSTVRVALAGLMEISGALAVFVSLSVAVVVLAVVAKFAVGRFHFANAASPRSILAGLLTALADTDAGGTGRSTVALLGLSALAATAIIDLSIAIVVDVVVAGFGRFGSHFTRATSPLTVLAGPDSSPARRVASVRSVRLFGTSSGTREANFLVTTPANATVFVGLPIAVVVELVIALFGAGSHSAGAGT